MFDVDEIAEIEPSRDPPLELVTEDFVDSESLSPAEKLMDALLGLAIEHAGAERGLLLLSRGNELRQWEEATANEAAFIVEQPRTSSAASPDSIIQYALRTRELLILDDASAHPMFSNDPDIRTRRAKSVLCMPLLNGAKLAGLLYLENNAAAGAFASSRIAMLKLIVSQAAISLENARLYRDLAERESKIRHLVDANIIGIFVIDIRGPIIEANDAFLRMVGYEREDLVSGSMSWMDLTPEWRAADVKRLETMKATGRLEPFEKEYFRKDRSRVPVLVGGARFDEIGERAVIFAIDLTERKLMEAEAQENQRRLHEAQMELAHASRVATVGQLSASIAHEISQPLSGIVTNTSTCLRMLSADSPNIAGAQEAARRAMRDARRATDIVARLHALFSKRQVLSELVDLNEALREVAALSQKRFHESRVTLQLELADDIPLVEGDRIQIQQVMLNLIRNAVDAMIEVDDRPRQLTIRTGASEADGVLLVVQDSGPGMDPASVERIFDPFYTTKADGLGMGLSVCRTIINAHGGDIWAIAADPYGAVFQIAMPARRNGAHRPGAA
jgi:PAS domain S-box-containing protein